MNKRKYLTWDEVCRLIDAASRERTGVRDRCLILMAFMHGMRVSELLELRFRDLNLVEKRMNVRRLKNGFSTIHPLGNNEVIALTLWRRVRSEWITGTDDDLVFISRRGKRLSRSQAWRLIRRAGEIAGVETVTHPHMLRHACGYELAERGADTRLIQDYLGHRNIRHTVRYTASNAARFAGMWERDNRKGEEKNGINVTY